MGQGLAGTMLAFELLQRGEDVIITDAGHSGSSTMVAAGLWNPISFRTLAPAWIFERLYPVMEQVYPALETLLHQEFYHHRDILRVHSSPEEANNWSGKLNSPEGQAYISDIATAVVDSLPLNAPFGIGLVRQAGFVDLPVFLKAAASYFRKNGMLQAAKISLHDIDFQKSDGPAGPFDRIIFCQGAAAAQNAPFDYLPFRVTKGELLHIRCSGLKLDQILNAGFFLKPLGREEFILGATFSHRPENDKPTSEAREELLEKFYHVVNLSAEVLDQQAGIRPNVADRRPLMGRHPELENAYIFNGLGSKGVMLAPYWATVFAQHLCSGTELPAEVDVKRFVKRFRHRRH